MLSFPGTYTTLRSNLAKVSCHQALLAAGPEGVSTCSLCQLCRDWWSVQTTTGCSPMWPDHFLSAHTMAYVSFSLAVHVRRWPSARILLQNATGT